MIFQKKHTFLLDYFPAATSGLLLTLCFPSTGFAYLVFFALVPWFISLGSMTAKQAVYSGFIAGLFHFLSLVYWIAPTLNIYGGLHPVLAGSTLALFCCYLALYPTVFAFLLKKINAPSFFTPLWAACLWTGLEYIRTYAFTGFSWGALGYSQYSNLLFIQVADFSGVYGVSFLIVLVNFMLATVWTDVKNNRQKSWIIPFLYTLVLISGTVFYGHYRISAVKTLIKTADKATITVVQGNIKQDLKWSAAFKTKTIDKYIRLSTTGETPRSDLIIWPETALPFYYGYDQKLSDRVDQCIRSVKTNFLIGSPAFTRDNGKIKFYNRAYMMNRFSIVTGTYDKNHLVPFGEYVPFGDTLTFLGKLTAQAGNFSTGNARFTPLAFNDRNTGVLICFEILFPSIASGFVKNGADVLTTITNDAWFGRTSAPQQHFSIAVFRAVENRRTIARAANTGISGFIDPTGNILAASGLFTDAALTQTVPMLKQTSFYTNHGDIFAISTLVAFCLVFMVKGLRKNDEEKLK